MSPVTRKPVFGVCKQVRHKPACPATKASPSLENLDIASIGIILSKQRTTKALIRLRGCAGDLRLCWSHDSKNRFSHDVAQIRLIPLLHKVSCLECFVFVIRMHYTKFSNFNEPPRDKTNKMTVRPAKTQISLDTRPVWLESSLSAWRKLGSLATHWTHSEGSDQTERMPRLIWVFAGRTVILLVLSWDGSFS